MLITHSLQVAVVNPAPEEGWDPNMQPPQILLGILASDSRVAMRALHDWTTMLGTPFIAPQSRVSSFTRMLFVLTLHVMCS